MYNRYIPQEADFVPVSQQSIPQKTEEKTPFNLKDFLSGGKITSLQRIWQDEGRDPLGGLLQSLNLEGIDSGDILLVLLILFLLVEGEDSWELVITLGLLLILGLGEKKTEPQPPDI